MGEEIAARESLYNNQSAGTYFVIDCNLQTNGIVCVKSFTSNKLIYFHNAVFGYNKSKSNSTLEAALMFKHEDVDGDIRRDC